MGWQIVNTDPQPDDHDWSRVKFGTEQAARSHARFLNEEEDRRASANAASSGASS